MNDILPHFTLESFNSYIGLPYEEIDCYGLAIKFYREFMHRELDLLYDVRPSEKETAEMFEVQKERFVKVDVPQFGDIMVLRVEGLPCHIGIYIDNERFLHTRRHTGSVLDRLQRWKKRVIGYYRWPKSKQE